MFLMSEVPYGDSLRNPVETRLRGLVRGLGTDPLLRGRADQSSHKVTFIMRWRPKRCAKSSGQPLGLPRPDFGFERQI